MLYSISVFSILLSFRLSLIEVGCADINFVFKLMCGAR